MTLGLTGNFGLIVNQEKQMPFEVDQLVRHPLHSEGTVQRDRGETVVVDFGEKGLLTVKASELSAVKGIAVRLEEGSWDAPLPTLLRAAALAIRSTNDRWGVFSPSKIQLLPHQLWVCQKVIAQEPARWLVADDVGLGKSIEAGLILSALKASERLKRVLILSPASLVHQWQERMDALFGIGLTAYAPEEDAEGGRFWRTHHQVIASLQTIRQDKDSRRSRLREAEPWDLVIVDEAHHLNVEQGQKATLAYSLLQELEAAGKIRSMLFFTGTPHRGKNFGFLSLLKLLRPSDFDPHRPLYDQLALLPEVMIRNNKALVTDMSGKRLFQPHRVTTHEYQYSPEEAAFYARLSQYLREGRAFASKLDGFRQQQVALVLTVLQKYASSSIAAGRRALEARLESRKRKLRDEQQAVKQRAGNEEFGQRLSTLTSHSDAIEDWALDKLAADEEQFLLEASLPIIENEITALQELLALADSVRTESKRTLLMEKLDNELASRSVLIFTEYKATQAGLVEALECHFGAGSVTFINGDEALEVRDATTGQRFKRQQGRREAAARFNEGRVRFLVSTEAAGEGIDLQMSCHTLCHYDLPWNPMRLHQRLGRLNRIGQKHPVEVLQFLNAGTVEGRIWQLLQEKLKAITTAFSTMDDPEDMLVAVLGAAASETFTRLFTDAPATQSEADRWFSRQTQGLGTGEMLNHVRELFGNAARFEFGGNQTDLPHVDLPDLLPFFRAQLWYLGRRPDLEGLTLTSSLPEGWQKDRLLPRNIRLSFSREEKSPQAQRAGLTHKLVQRALAEALDFPEKLTLVRNQEKPRGVVTITETLSGAHTLRRQVLLVEGASNELHILRDWELLKALNELLAHPQALQRKEQLEPPKTDEALAWMRAAERLVKTHLSKLQLPMQHPQIQCELLIWPEKLAVVG